MMIRTRGHHGYKRARQSPPGEVYRSRTQQRDRGSASQALSLVRVCGWVAHSLSWIVRVGEGTVQSVTNPRQWVLWTLPALCVVWMLASEVTAGVSAGWMAWSDGWPPLEAWGRLAVLAIAAAVYTARTRLPEERRRAADLRRIEHVDQTSIYLFTGALTLPASLMIALLILVRTPRYFIASKPFARFLFTSAAIGMSCLGVHAAADLTPLGQWLAAPLTVPSASASIGVVAGGAAAIGAYFLAQAVVIGIGRVLAQDRLSWSSFLGRDERGELVSPVLGSLRDQVDILRALGLAAVATLTMLALHGALLLVVVTPLAIGDTRRAHQLQRATHNNFTDRMTGLPNDLAFETEGAMAVHLDHVLNQPTQVAALDLDFFKKINDSLGHAAGDTALRALAGVLTTAKGRLIRSSDLAARLHGEEFAVLLPNTTLAEAVEVMERVRYAVEQLRVPVTKAAGGTMDVISMTVSIGIATVTVTRAQPAHVALSEAMENADAATYDAKRAGRNRVSVYAPPAASDTRVDDASVLGTQLRV